MINTKSTAEIDTANNAVDATEPKPVWRQFNWEIYTRNPDTGERGWEIQFRNVTATSKRRAYALLDESELFDVAILYNGSVPAPIEEERIWDTPEAALEEGWTHTHPDAPQTVWAVYWDTPRAFGVVREVMPSDSTEPREGCEWVAEYYTETTAILHLQRLESGVKS